MTLPGRRLDASEALWARARSVIPLGTQTLSKSPTQFVDGVSPKFLSHGRGSHVWDVDGNEYVDWPMALGPILLGYDEPAVTEAVIAQAHAGPTFTLMHPLEVEVAELLVDIVPCAEQVRFAKNGADATNAAIRAARALTGREHVIATGYHGGHDWYIASTDRRAGIPAHNRELIQSRRVRRPRRARRRAAGAGSVAAVIMEVPAEEPPAGYLAAAIDLAHAHGALFVLDEIVTGFRARWAASRSATGSVPTSAAWARASPTAIRSRRWRARARRWRRSRRSSSR